VRWQSRPVRVRAPATSANLGPGFDALGLALALDDQVEARILPSGLAIEVSGSGAEAGYAGEDHLVVRAMRAAFDELGGQPPGLGLRCQNAIPQGVGLGSSAAAIVAGLLAARVLAGDVTPAVGATDIVGAEAPAESAGVTAGCSDATARRAVAAESAGATAGRSDAAARRAAAAARRAAAEPGSLAGTAWLRLAAELEGHPDNVAACMMGGLTIAWALQSGPRAARLSPLPDLAPVICIPPEPLATSAARQALPTSVPHADAAANAARAALLIAALTQDPGLLMDATEDFLHQRYRASAMPRTAELIKRLRDAGIPAVISGAGPATLALTVAGSKGADAVRSIAAGCGAAWLVRPLRLESQGATAQLVQGD
jgi:homoserine kinase